MQAFEEINALHFQKFDEIITLKTVCVRVCVCVCVCVCVFVCVLKKKRKRLVSLEKQMLKLAFDKSATTERSHTNIGLSI